MVFTKLKLDYFGRFQDCEIEIKPGINLIYGENEAGKSTIHTFIKGMLFGIERLRGRGSASKEDYYTRYLPWDYPGAYSGSMDIGIGEKEYRLQRSFHASDKSFTVLDLSTGREVKLKENLISELIPGLTESAFKNTISIEQLKAQTDAELAAQVRNYIANLSIAKSKEVNVAKAVNMLNEQRKQLELTQNGAMLKTLEAEIEEGLMKEEKIDGITLKLMELQKKEKSLEAEKDKVENTIDSERAKMMEQLPAIIEKYHSYEDMLKQEANLGGQIKELEGKISHLEEEQSESANLKDDMPWAQRLQTEILEQENNGMELKRQKDSLIKEDKRNLLVSIPLASIAACLIILLSSFHLIGICTGALILLGGLIAYVFLKRNSKIKMKSLEEKEVVLIEEKETLQRKLHQLLHKYKVTRVEELTLKLEDSLRDTYALQHAREQKEALCHRRIVLEDNRDILYETIMKYIQYFVYEEELTPAVIQRLKEEITNKRNETVAKLSEINSQLHDCRLSIEKLKWEIAALEGNEEELLKNKERYNELELKQKEDAIELNAVKLALSTIQELSTDIHDSFGQQLNKAVSQVISEITDERYKDLKIDEKLEIKVDWKGKYVLLDRLSAGTIDQVYFALRMAVADLLLGTEEVPLILDDSFALYDDTRVGAVLAKLAMRGQVILFTCHKREQRLLEELGLSYHLVDLSLGR